MDGEINYNEMVERALMQVVRDSLNVAVKTGLVGQQHFYITFLTQHPGIQLPAQLYERYKEEMTIVLQHQYWNLIVEDTYFSLELSFNHRRETLIIPFDAITAFADPSAQFGLQFNASSHKASLETEPMTGNSGLDAEENVGDPIKEEKKVGEVIALDTFRKK
ncbi:MAG: ClpXP protease specificity-enhancing factor SspB [Sneathiella sp.]